MKTSTWHHQWVIGLYTSPEQAERMIALAKGEGVPTSSLVVIGPDSIKKRRFLGLRPEPHHPEGRWMWRGAMIGLTLGTIVGAMLLSGHAASVVGHAALAVLCGVGAAIVGGLFSLIASGADASLTALYEESGAEGKIMVAINCHPHHAEETQLAQRLIRQSGVHPQDFPHQSSMQ